MRKWLQHFFCFLTPTNKTYAYKYMDALNTFCEALSFYLDIFRGGVIIKKQENLGLFPKQGGGSEKKQKSLKFKFGHLKTDGGVSIVQKCLNYKLLTDHILKNKKLRDVQKGRRVTTYCKVINRTKCKQVFTS